MKNIRHIQHLAVFCMTAWGISVFFTACNADKQAKTEENVRQLLPDAPAEVTVIPLKTVDFEHELVSNGKISARTVAEVKFQTSEIIETISLLFPEKEHVKELKLAIEEVETTLKVEAAELESLLNKINSFYENDEQGLAALDFAKAFDNLVTALEINHEEIKSDQTEQELQETLEDFMYTSDEESRELMNVYSAVDSDTIKLLKEEQEILRERWAYTISDEGGGQFDYDNPVGISIDGGEIEWIETNNEVTKTRKVDWEP